MEELQGFLSSQQFLIYSKKNPKSAKEITGFLIQFLENNKSIPGIKTLYKILFDVVKSEKSPPLKWFNIFSQIRCTVFLISKGVQVNGVEIARYDKKLDFKLSDGSYGEIKSFSTIDERLVDPQSIDEYVIKNFVEKKVKPAFDDQKADLLIVDDIFAHYSEQYGLLDYFLSFIIDPYVLDRQRLIQQHLGLYLPKILYLSFVESITVNPRIKLIGDQFKKLGL